MNRLARGVAAVLLPALFFAGWPAPAAEAPDPAAEAMRAVAPLAGRWEGEGTVRHGPGEPEKFVGQEKVEIRLDGQILIIEGTHWNPERTRIVHQALAVLSYDGAAKAYRFKSHLPGGRGGDFPFAIENGAFVWEIPSAKMRYTIKIDGDRWHEVGTIEKDGKPVQFFEMTLRRVGP